MANDTDIDVHIRGHDDTGQMLAKMIPIVGGIAAAAQLATQAFFKFADAQEGMVKLANSTNLAKERVKEIYTEMERLAGKTGFGVESLNTAFRNFVSRTGMDDANAEAVFKDLASAAVLADTSVEEMTQSAGAALRNMRIPGDQAKEMFSGIASGMGEMSKSFIADLPRLTLDMANLGMSGADNMKKLITEYHVAAQAMGSTANASSALHSILTGVADSSSKLGERAHQMVAANEAAGASADVLLDNLTKFYYKEGALEATWRGRQKADINGLTALQAEYFRRRYEGLGKMTEAEKEYAVRAGEAKAKIAAMEATVTAELRALGYAIGESVIEVGTLIGELGKLMGVNTSIKSVSSEIRTIADTIKEVNNLVSGAAVDWSKLTPSFDFSFNKPPVIATLQREHEIAKQQGENTSALNKLTDTLLKKLGFGGAGVKPMSFGGSAIGNDSAGGARLWNAGYGGTGTYGSGSTFMTPYSSGGSGGGFQRASFGGPGGGPGGGYDRGSSGGYPGRGGVGGRGSTKGGDPGVGDNAPKMSQGPTGIWQDRQWPGPGPGSDVGGGGGGTTPAGGYQAGNVPMALQKHVGFWEAGGLGRGQMPDGSWSYNSDSPNRRHNATEAEARKEMNDDLAQGLNNVNRLNPNLPDGTKHALASLGFNVGQGIFSGSDTNPDGSPTLKALIKKGNISAIHAKGMEFVKAEGQYIQGLYNRRMAEFGPGGYASRNTNRTASPGGDSAQPSSIAMRDTPFGQQPMGGGHAIGAGTAATTSNGDVASARAYLAQTATPGSTMTTQGVEKAIGRLHPELAQRLSSAIKEARESGLSKAGVFSAYRSPSMGANPNFARRSVHGVGGAVDMTGIGRPGSAEAQQWYAIATKHGLHNPYGPEHQAEWNHYQLTADKSAPISFPDQPLGDMTNAWSAVKSLKPETISQVAGPGAGSEKEDTWGKDARPIEHTGVGRSAKADRDTTYDDDTPAPMRRRAHGPPAPDSERTSQRSDDDKIGRLTARKGADRDTTYDDDTPAPPKRSTSHSADTGVNKQVSRPPKKEPNNPASRSADHTIHKRWGDSKRSGSVNH